MKHAVIALLGAAVASAHQHYHQHDHQRDHQHGHHAKREQSTPVDVVSVAGPTVVVYELNGRLITDDEVQQGLRNGSLVMASHGQVSSAAASTYAVPSAPAAYVVPLSSSSSVWIEPASTLVLSSSSAVESSASSTYVAQSSYAAPSPSQESSELYDSSANDEDDGNDSGTGIDENFPDGELDCSQFPEDYGAIPVEWMGLGGWTGIQQPGSYTGGFSNIKTALYGEGCTEGAYCSYACPAGYQKSQWPSDQGASGQSIGGVHCQGGKLRLTNKSMSGKLCMSGTTKVEVKVENRLGQNVSVCRTDYPGTEGQTVPLNTMPDKTYPLTCPEADNYYKWQGGKTSAQYYVNPAGVAMNDACQWGSPANPWGNFAPMNLGVGYSNGRAWLSIFQNSPTTDAKLEFSVELKGDDMSGSCKYSNGQYCSDTGCSSTTGCTVSIGSGTATFVFS